MTATKPRPTTYRYIIIGETEVGLLIYHIARIILAHGRLENRHYYFNSHRSSLGVILNQLLELKWGLEK